MNKKAVAVYGELLALQAELEGMKAFNEERRAMGASPAYTEDDFLNLAHRIRSVARELADERAPRD